MAAASIWQFVSFWTHLAGAISCVLLAILVGRSKQQFAFKRAAIVALFATAVWSVIAAAFGPLAPWAFMAESARNIGWLYLLYSLFSWDGRAQSSRPVRPLVIILAVLELFQPVLVFTALRPEITAASAMLVFNIEIMFRLLVITGALVLVHNLFAGGSAAARTLLRWPAAALGAMWVYDLNFLTIGYVTNGLSFELAALRGLVTVAAAVMLGIAASRRREELRFQPSRAVTFQSLSLLVIAGYLLAMIVLARLIALIGGDIARLSQVGFVVFASVVALLWLPSENMRRWLRVTTMKHLFRHRYDYREEWLRSTRTIGRAGAEAPPLDQRAVQALADITDSPGGLLLLPSEEGGLTLAARWQWDEVEVPSAALGSACAGFFEREHYILDLDDLRAGRDIHGQQADLPDWLLADPSAWAMVPLIHYDRLTGIVVLCRPAFTRKLDWEDFDLLRVVGQQLASYLSEQAGQQALNEAARFEEFNRRIAFVMHDIKNLASQLSLLARNAERHADKAEFRADMLITLRNSAEKLNSLLARLGRYGAQGSDRRDSIALADVAKDIAARYDPVHPTVLVDAVPCQVMADREALEQALIHLVQNAIDASQPDRAVMLRVAQDGVRGTVEVVDSGAGMSPEFVRTGLFKPFVSSKSDGFGIGAFEARELIRAMSGRLEVESREGLGTRFMVSLPLAGFAQVSQQHFNEGAKVA